MTNTKMKKWNVDIHYDFAGSVVVEAETEEDARDMVARMVDNGEINPRLLDPTGDYELDTSYQPDEEDMEEPRDRHGLCIFPGDKVIWFDPDPEGRNLNRVWKVDEIVNEEIILIEDQYSQAEVPPHELEIIRR